MVPVSFISKEDHSAACRIPMQSYFDINGYDILYSEGLLFNSNKLHARRLHRAKEIL